MLGVTPPRAGKVFSQSKSCSPGAEEILSHSKRPLPGGEEGLFAVEVFVPRLGGTPLRDPKYGPPELEGLFRPKKGSPP